MKKYKLLLTEKTKTATDKIEKLITSIEEILKVLLELKNLESHSCAGYGETSSTNEAFSADAQIDCLETLRKNLIEEIDNYNIALQYFDKCLSLEPQKISGSSSHAFSLDENQFYRQARENEAIAYEIKKNSNYILNTVSDMLKSNHIFGSEKLFNSMQEYDLATRELSEVYITISEQINNAVTMLINAENSIVSSLTEKEEKKQEESVIPINQSDDIPPPKVDSVQFLAVTAEKAIVGKYLPLSIVMYEEHFKKSVDDIILSSFGKKAKKSKSGYQEAERHSTIKITLFSPDLKIENIFEEQVWNGKYLNFEFVVKIPEDFVDKQILFVASVYINDIIATKLKLVVDCEAAPKHNISITRNDILSAFISYANPDRSRVAAIIQGMKKVRPDMDIFFDIENLRSGQNWEDVLKDEIDNRDVLFLCWSKSAKDSEWVNKEWRYALKKKGEDGIEPIPIDPPDICPPPVELCKKHFNDKMLYYH